LAESVGLPGITFAQIAKGESGFIPTAIGHDPGGTTGYGLWQITSGYNDEIIAKYGGPEGILVPRNNAMAAKDIYDTAGIGAWYGTRYMTGSNLHYKGGALNLGRGGKFDVHGPTRMVVGENANSRPETVTVTPKGQTQHGGLRAGRVHIDKVEIVNNREGDIQKQLERELKKFAAALDDEADVSADEALK
jgi:hypothetical protein